ncbi:acid protease [Wilcoxina mikolae CBS 423.85]|nr:acid protease [Wilcoxina mikolae CBS 423.85]
MKYTSFIICAALLLTKVLAAEQSDINPITGDRLTTRPRSFKFEKVNKNPLNIPRRQRHRKRAGSVLQRLENQDFLYYAAVSLGTPPQPLRLHLDTGSSDIWVESAKSDLCQQADNPCNITGTFNRDESSTYSKVSSDFQISYVDGEYAQGDYGKDVFHLGDGSSVKGVHFGIGLESTSTEGIMGIGFEQNEVQVQRLGKPPYAGLADLMVQQGLIQSMAYSLWLNDLDASEGEILFGGVDTAKFKGQLTTLPIDKRSGDTKAREFMITLTSVGLTNDKGNSLTLTKNNFAVPVLLDTGTTYTYLPTDLFQEICNQVGAQVNDRTGVPIVPCNIRSYKGSVDYSFSGAVINVPLNELVVNAYTYDGSPATFDDGTPLCYFGILDAGSGNNVLGDTFLRSAYIVFDLENEEISIGKALFNVSDSNIMEIGKGKNAVPDATGAKNAITVAPTATGGGRSNNMPIASGDVTLSAVGFATGRPSSRSGAHSRGSLWSGLAFSFLVTMSGFVI